MNQVTSFKLAISPSFPTYEREMLLAVLKDEATIQTPEEQTPEERVFSIDDYIVIVTAVGATIGAIGTAAKATKEIGELIEKIIDWRKRLRKKTIEPEIKLERSGQDSLDLRTATDEEIRRWLSQ